jgi:hypothetical protein
MLPAMSALDTAGLTVRTLAGKPNIEPVYYYLRVTATTLRHTAFRRFRGQDSPMLSLHDAGDF